MTSRSVSKVYWLLSRILNGFNVHRTRAIIAALTCWIKCFETIIILYESFLKITLLLTRKLMSTKYHLTWNYWCFENKFMNYLSRKRFIYISNDPWNFSSGCQKVQGRGGWILAQGVNSIDIGLAYNLVAWFLLKIFFWSVCEFYHVFVASHIYVTYVPRANFPSLSYTPLKFSTLVVASCRLYR